MKPTILTLITILTLFTFTACADRESGAVSMYVSAPSGLVMRAEASKAGKKQGVIPYRTQVTVIEQSDKTMTIEGTTGHWTRVEHDGQAGWVFGGFLSATPIVEREVDGCAAVEDCMQACREKFGTPDDYNGMHEGCDHECRDKVGDGIKDCDRALWSQADWERYDPEGLREMMGDRP